MDTPASGHTRLLRPGDEIRFAMVPIGADAPVDGEDYLERITDRVIRTPQGVEARLNILCDADGTVRHAFAFTQDPTTHDIWLHGVVPWTDEGPQAHLAMWVDDPAEGRTLNYPGSYQPGQRWSSRFSLAPPEGPPPPPVALDYAVGSLEPIEVPAGRFLAFPITATAPDGSRASLGWFAPEAGIQVAMTSYTGPKPGYVLRGASFL
jgi:hypothetical protein